MERLSTANKAFLRYAMIAIAVMQVVLCASCSNTESLNGHSRHNVVALLDKAESMLGTDDSTALATLNSINSTAIRGRKQNARYALLYSEALYKNYITVPSDSLIMTAVRYYSSTNDAEHQFRAFYMLGCIYDELGQTTDAAVALGQAEQIADNITDDYRLGLFFSEFGDIFFKSFDFERALHYYQSAYDCYQNAGKVSHGRHALYDIGRCFLEKNEYEKAHKIFSEVKEKSIEDSDWNLVYNSVCSQLCTSLIVDSIVRASVELDTLVRLFGVPENDPFAISLFAGFNIMRGKYNEAYRYIEIGWQNSETASDSIRLYLCESQLAEIGGNSQDALQKYRQSIFLQHKNLFHFQSKPALGALKDYYREVAQVESLKESRKKGQIIFLSILFALTVISLTSVMKYRRLKSVAALSELNWIIADFRLKENTSNAMINELNVQINDLFKGTYSKLDRILAELLESENILQENDTEQSRNKLQAAVYNRIRSSIDELTASEYQEHLDSLINSAYNDIMKCLTDAGLKKRDLLLFRFLIAGFSPKSTSYILRIPVKTLYQNRSRILKKVAETNPQLHTDLCNVLNINHSHR